MGILQKSSRIRRNVLVAGFALAFAVAHFLPTFPARSQATLNIAAVVNDEIISVYDLSQRILLVIHFSNMQNTLENQQRIAPDVLRRLITEKLRLQEAKHLGIEISEDEIQKALAEFEKRNNIPPKQVMTMLEQRGIDPESLKQQITADLVWIDIVRSLFRRLVSVSEQEVDDILAKMRANAGKQEYRVAEIFLAYDEKPRNEVEQVAQRIHAQLGNGSNWPQIAQSFSESASAANGGDIGWNLASDLGNGLGDVIARLEPGQISLPIPVDDGVYILMLRDKRVAKGLDSTAENITLGIHQLHLSIPPNADANLVAQTTNNASTLAASASDCEAFGRISESEGSPSSGFLGQFKLEQLNPQLRSMVQTLNVNQSSQPLRTADGVIVLMVCSRESEGQSDPVAAAREEIERRLLNRRMERLAGQHEDKLRRQAFIEIRL